MRVLFDHQAFTMQTHGGVSRSFVELYHHFPQEVEATIGVLESDNVYIQWLGGIKPSEYQYHHFLWDKDFCGKGYLHRWYDKLTGGGYYPDYNKNNSIKLLQEGNFDVFHPTYFDDYFLPYLNGKPFVLTIHDMIPELYPQYFARDDFQIVKKRKLAPLASAIITVSEHTKRDVVRLLDVPESKVHIIYHGCSFPALWEAKPIYDLPYILYVGERRGYKNFIPFVKSIAVILKSHPTIHVICTGRPFVDEELRLMDSLCIRERFIHHWAKSDAVLFTLYHNALCFIYASEYEGFGIPILEAYQAECPVMLNNASCFPEIAGDAAVYFTLDERRNNLPEVMEHFINMTTSEKMQLREKQNKRLKLYSWEKAAQELYQVYLSVASHGCQI